MKDKHEFAIPGIGMRIIKSAVAVSLCMVINIIRGEGGMVFPFAAALVPFAIDFRYFQKL